MWSRNPLLGLVLLVLVLTIVSHVSSSPRGRKDPSKLSRRRAPVEEPVEEVEDDEDDYADTSAKVPRVAGENKLSKDISTFLGKLFGVQAKILGGIQDDEKELEDLEDATNKLYKRKSEQGKIQEASESVESKEEVKKSKKKRKKTKEELEEEREDLRQQLQQFAQGRPEPTLDMEELLRRTEEAQAGLNGKEKGDKKKKKHGPPRSGLEKPEPEPLPNFAFDHEKDKLSNKYRGRPHGPPGGHGHHGHHGHGWGVPAHNFDPDLDPEVEKIRLDIFRQKKRLKKWKKIVKWEVVELKSEIITKIIDFLEFITPA